MPYCLFIAEEVGIEWTFETERDFGDQVIRYLSLLLDLREAQRDGSGVTKQVLGRVGEGSDPLCRGAVCPP